MSFHTQEARDKRRIEKTEQTAFRDIIEKRNLAIRRQAFAQESQKQAKIEGERRAREESERRARGSFGSRVFNRLVQTTQQKILSEPQKAPLRRAPIRRRTPLRRAPIRRRAPLTRLIRAPIRRRTPLRRAPLRRLIRSPLRRRRR